MGECTCFIGHECNYYCKGGRHQDLGYSTIKDMNAEDWNNPWIRFLSCDAEFSCQTEVVEARLTHEAPSERERYGSSEGKRPFAYLLTFIRKET